MSSSGLLLSLALVLLLLHSSSPHKYEDDDEAPRHNIFHNRDSSMDLPKVIMADIFDRGDSSASASDADSSLSADELVLLPSRGVSKRRRGPTLSVVNPLEVLRQRLMLDLAKQRIRENQKQIVANGELLEKIGKRAMRP